MPLSGAQWVAQFPTSDSLDDLTEPFRSNAKQFIGALRAAKAAVTINDTLRRPQRAYLMHYGFAIAKEGLDPASVPPMNGVDIQWVHTNAPGQKDLAERTRRCAIVVTDAIEGRDHDDDDSRRCERRPEVAVFP